MPKYSQIDLLTMFTGAKMGTDARGEEYRDSEGYSISPVARNETPVSMCTS